MPAEKGNEDVPLVATVHAAPLLVLQAKGDAVVGPPPATQSPFALKASALQTLAPPETAGKTLPSLEIFVQVIPSLLEAKSPDVVKVVDPPATVIPAPVANALHVVKFKVVVRL